MPSSAMLLWGLIFGSIGLGYFMYGRKQKQIVVRYTGIALMIYPYVITDTITVVLVGVVLMFIPKLYKMYG